MRTAKAKADAPQEAEPTEVVDIRTKIHQRRAGLAPERRSVRRTRRRKRYAIASRKRAPQRISNPPERPSADHAGARSAYLQEVQWNSASAT
ncbi:hypothetical protein GS928_25920 [Rhodococcus hoagii]|nr:hypothetical protein [Prescottella equi]